MTPEEVARFVLVPLATAHPKAEIPEATAAMWCAVLQRTPPDHALEATERAIRALTKFPTPADWLTAHRGVCARYLPDDTPALPARPDPTTAKERIAELRSHLRKADDPRQETQPQDNPTTQGEPDHARRTPLRSV